MCDRHYGVGGDGVIFAMNSELHPELDSAAEKGAADYKMVIYNSDGEGGGGVCRDWCCVFTPVTFEPPA